jgi:esterase
VRATDRHYFRSDGLNLSYLDAGGDGREIIALHSHWMEGSTFSKVADLLYPEFRVVALDQRGHGYSDHASSYTREDYISDLSTLYDHLGLRRGAVLLGNSLGGVNAYQFAARYPDRVSALIIEDIGVVISEDTSFVLKWKGTFQTREELENRIGPRLAPYLRNSFREVSGGWRLAFDPEEMLESQNFVNGDHWKDWLASYSPALILRGRDSRITSQEHLEQMASRRPNTQLFSLDGGHVIHEDNPSEFAKVVRTFLASAYANDSLRVQ